MQVSVVVPVYNALAFARACIASIFDAGAEISFEVIVVDNGSTPDVEEWLAAEEAAHPQLRHQRFCEPLGFAKAVNAGAACATGEVLIVLNSDTIVTSGWMEGLYRALMTDPSLGAITPSTNRAGEPVQMDFSTIDLPLAKALAQRAEKRKPEIVCLPQRITFFCVALRREVWLGFGGLDESYGTGNFEDDDLCLRLRMAGYRLGVAKHLFVYHHNNATFHENRIDHGACLARNTALFAARARAFAETCDPPPRRWPKRTASDVSVVIHAGPAGGLERTLRSLANQTVEGFEIVPPRGAEAPTRAWTAHITEGDIMYPFHLETLLDAIDRGSADAIFADGWAAAEETAIRNSLPPSGWMHHSSLDRDRLREQCVPINWPRLTWEMRHAPPISESPAVRSRRGPVDFARSIYRKIVSFETRLKIDVGLQRFLSLSLADGMARRHDEASLRKSTIPLDALLASGSESGKFAIDAALPAVVMFNAIAWNSAVQRQQHFARGLAQRGHPVFWVETDLRPSGRWWNGRPFQQAAPRLHIVRLPGASRDIYHMKWTPATLDAMLVALLLAASAYGLRGVVSLVNYPRWQPIAARLRKRAGWKIVYDCLDDQAALADLYQTDSARHEEFLLKDADLFFTSSLVLHERFAHFSPILLPNAADYDLFSSSTPIGHLRGLGRPVIGFFGALADWLDMDLVHAAALRFPAWSFVYIGPSVFSGSASEARWFRSTNLPNITIFPQMDHGRLAEHLAEFDVCIMPFLDLPVTRTMNAVKIYEYLAAGKPVVSRDLPEVRRMTARGADSLVSLYSSHEEFFARLQEAAGSNTPEITERRRSFARQNDWAQRIDLLSRKITELSYETSSSSAASSGSKTRFHE